MVWYNPLSWFKENGSAQELLICDNSQCGKNIRDSKVLYDSGRNEVYHGDDCARMAMALRAFSSKSVTYGSIDLIFREEALRRKNPKGLDDKVK